MGERDATKPYAQRLADAWPLTIALWESVKKARDAARSRMHEAELELEELELLLRQMKDAGMADHLPTLHEVREAFTSMRTSASAIRREGRGDG